MSDNDQDRRRSFAEQMESAGLLPGGNKRPAPPEPVPATANAVAVRVIAGLCGVALLVLVFAGLVLR